MSAPPTDNAVQDYPADGQAAEDFYDQLSDLLCRAMGTANIHQGYWPDSDGADTISAASDRLTDLVIEKLGPVDGKTVLDVGSGPGRPALRVAGTTGATVVGIALSRHQIEVATGKAAAENLANRVRFEYADAVDLPFASDSFDAAWAIESLIHMADRPAALREIARVLRPGARLVVSDLALRAQPDDEQGQGVLAAFTFGAAIPAPIPLLAAYPGLLRDAGFRVVEQLDLSEQIRRSYVKAVDGIRSVWPEILAAVGDEAMAEGFVANIQAFGALPQTGYVLVTAVKDER